MHSTCMFLLFGKTTNYYKMHFNYLIQKKKCGSSYTRKHSFCFCLEKKERESPHCQLSCVCWNIILSRSLKWVCVCVVGEGEFKSLHCLGNWNYSFLFDHSKHEALYHRKFSYLKINKTPLCQQWYECTFLLRVF